MQLSLGDFVAARRSLKKAVFLGSQQPLDRQTVKKAFKYGEWTVRYVVLVFFTWVAGGWYSVFLSYHIADQGCKLEEELGEDQGKKPSSHQAVGLAEQLGDLCCKVGCYSKALEAYQAQVRSIKRVTWLILTFFHFFFLNSYNVESKCDLSKAVLVLLCS